MGNRQLRGRMKTNGSEHFSFRHLPEEEVINLITHRTGETKLGEVLAKDWRDASCRYVLLGICEDIGPRANNGLGGARNGFDAFLPNFLNLQANRFITPGSLHLLGRIDHLDPDAELDQATMRTRVEDLDGLVLRTVLPIMQAGKVPIVIGGGRPPSQSSGSPIRRSACHAPTPRPATQASASRGRGESTPSCCGAANLRRSSFAMRPASLSPLRFCRSSGVILHRETILSTQCSESAESPARSTRRGVQAGSSQISEAMRPPPRSRRCE